MKKTLLFASVLLSGTTFAQLTTGNEPAIGENHAMFLCDTFASNYESVNGASAMWDFSAIGGVNNGSGGFITKNLSVQSVGSTPEGADFPEATKAVVIESFMTTYLSSTSSARFSEGFSFDGGSTFGTVNVVLAANNELLINYPFAYGNSLVDVFTGTVGIPTTPVCTGNNAASVDATGTLKLNAATTLTGVLRYKLVDTATANVFPIGEVKLVRTQFEYYHHATSNLPVFIHSKLDIVLAGSPTTQNIVLSRFQPDGFVGINENELSGISVFPNPATEIVSVKGLKENATLTLVDAQGKTVTTASVEPGVASLGVSNVNAGIYFLHIASGNGTKIERVVIR